MGQFQSLPVKLFLTHKRTEYPKTTAASSSATQADDLDFASFLKIICAFLLISHWIKPRYSSLSKEQNIRVPPHQLHAPVPTQHGEHGAFSLGKLFSSKGNRFNTRQGLIPFKAPHCLESGHVLKHYTHKFHLFSRVEGLNTLPP